MIAIVESDLYNSAVTTCDQLKTFAFESHPKCYADNGFCDDILVSPSCQNLLCLSNEVFVWSDFFNKLAILQVPNTFLLCSGSQILKYIRAIPSCAKNGLIQALNDSTDCNAAGLDVVLVLDSSGSIGLDNFERLKTFIIQILSSFTIGPDDTRVGVIRFSTDASIVIPLGSSGFFSELSSRINSISYDGGSTYTDKALLRLLSAFNTARTDEGVPSVAIVFTDGVSNSPSLTRTNARAVHNAGIYTYAFGIGSNIDSEELNYIASGSDYVLNINSFSSSDFETALRPLRTRACMTTSSLSIGNLITGYVGLKAFRLIKFSFPWRLGMTVKLAISAGDFIIRGSFCVPNPTELTQDFVVTSDGSDIDYFVSPELFESSTTVIDDSQQRRKRQAPTNVTDSNLYLSIIGVGNNNRFSLNTTYGDTTDAVSAAGGPTGLASLLISVSLEDKASNNITCTWPKIKLIMMRNYK
ncbi:PREDICTED: uncharacterized protein LOC109590790 [Amphimedon queenslandica]|uniref:VWFA domain-containing protein n=1 Tax=Amphimedon queenslandica TaxID=400682 RepID=A0AAN0JZ74_AMPQE|nr:PREDICTED: uncharacterized protein LOC109590790 [Amphimedon queenslandica]XP_019862224.1 PREDICTED: uncharacterized protein LOC109590790 [Amphimedon queenslandica]|eukprot:XP_019862223.1 PREDICTED: uncharacterized protein LOC109590790 [Amphimedon queenslandica]